MSSLDNKECKPGFGTALLGNRTYEMTKKAIKCGYRHIDTAPSYHNEEQIGLAIRELIKDGIIEREDVFITTKISALEIEGGNMLASIKKSLDNLDLGYIDLVLLHAPVIGMIKESWLKLEDIRDQSKNKIRYIGVSNYNLSNLNDVLDVCTVKPYSNQFEISPFLTRSKLADFCHDNGIRIIAHSSLTKGRKLNDPLLVKISGCYNRSVPQILLKWSLQKGYHVIPMTTNNDHLIDNFNLDFTLSDQHMEELDGLDSNYTTLHIPYFDMNYSLG